MPRMKVVPLLSLATLLAPAALFGQNANPARPGTINYVEGQVAIDGQTVKQTSVGSAEAQTGQVVTTGEGRAEVLLTPGIFLRMGHNSAVKMISPDLTQTVVELERGHADIEVDQIYKQNDIVILNRGIQTRLLKTGLYGFDGGTAGEPGMLKVFDGKAVVFPANNPTNMQDSKNAQKPDEVKGGHELALTGDGGKPQKFDKKAAENSLYDWGSLRSSYLNEANVQLASEYGGGSGYAPGWMWDEGLYGYTWLPGEGAFLNPFGFGFYSPYYLYGGGPFIGYGGFGGYGGYGYGRFGSGAYAHRGYGLYGGGLGRRGSAGGFRRNVGGVRGGNAGFHGGGMGGLRGSGSFGGGGGGQHGGGGGGGHH
jgi:hypothetical protein